MMQIHVPIWSTTRLIKYQPYKQSAAFNVSVYFINVIPGGHGTPIKYAQGIKGYNRTIIRCLFFGLLATCHRELTILCVPTPSNAMVVK